MSHHPLHLGKDEVSELNQVLSEKSAEHIIEWAHSYFDHHMVVTSSFGDATLAHLVWSVSPLIEVVLLDTQFLFPETLAFADELQQRMGGHLTTVQPEGIAADVELWKLDTDACCAVRKVAPLERLLEGRHAWMTGLRRDDSTTRSNTQVVALDPFRDVVKVNPIATWSEADVAAYKARHGLPDNPLTAQGYASIGCWPCTQPVEPGADPRSGRWAGQDKTECGLHEPRVSRVKVSSR
ncbi:MAG: phosphoadenylyl-sulfate reductase [Actinomycetota bacterium]